MPSGKELLKQADAVVVSGAVETASELGSIVAMYERAKAQKDEREQVAHARVIVRRAEHQGLDVKPARSGRGSTTKG